MEGPRTRCSNKPRPLRFSCCTKNHYVERYFRREFEVLHADGFDELYLRTSLFERPSECLEAMDDLIAH